MASGYTLATREQATDWMSQWPGFGEMRWYSDALGTEQGIACAQHMLEADQHIVTARRRATREERRHAQAAATATQFARATHHTIGRLADAARIVVADAGAVMGGE